MFCGLGLANSLYFRERVRAPHVFSSGVREADLREPLPGDLLHPSFGDARADAMETGRVFQISLRSVPLNDPTMAVLASGDTGGSPDSSDTMDEDAREEIKRVQQDFQREALGSHVTTSSVATTSTEVPVFFPDMQRCLRVWLRCERVLFNVLCLIGDIEFYRHADQHRTNRVVLARVLREVTAAVYARDVQGDAAVSAVSWAPTQARTCTCTCTRDDVEFSKFLGGDASVFPLACMPDNEANDSLRSVCVDVC
jgi:hypothetical protein